MFSSSLDFHIATTAMTNALSKEVALSAYR